MADQKNNTDDKPDSDAKKAAERPDSAIEQAQAEAAEKREKEGGYQ